MEDNCIQVEIPRVVLSEITRRSMISNVFSISKGSSRGLYVMEYMDYSKKIYNIISYGDEKITDFFKKYEKFDLDNAEYSKAHNLKKVMLLLSKLVKDLETLDPDCLIKIGSKEFSSPSELCLDDYKGFIKSVIN